ncbi:MAG: aspartate kinase [Verrucomicrobiota bacterium]|jgi:aspartate kinase
MSLIVQKYGGTSVANPGRIQNVARRVAGYRAKGDQVVVVVSAMSGVTDNLIKMAKELMPLPDEREMDMLLATGEQTTIALTAIALQALGVPAISLTGAQAGIVTDGVHNKAKIQNITPKQVHALLKRGQVVIVAGFQGQTMEGQITTLGRGGSDLTAIALAAALKADLCQIYTDVDGVYTADPRIVPNARKQAEISYDEMLELAGLGAKVMQSRSVEFAKKFGVVFEVRSSLNENPGTIVKEETPSMEGVVIRGVSLDKNQAKITLVEVPDRPGTAALVFQAIAEANINVDMIVQNISHNPNSPTTDISFTVDKPDLLKARKTIEGIQDKLGCRQVIADEKIGKLSIVGVGIRSHPGVAAKMFETLAQVGVNIGMISTSEIKISVTMDLAQGEEAMRAVHEAFLGK